MGFWLELSFEFDCFFCLTSDSYFNLLSLLFGWFFFCFLRLVSFFLLFDGSFDEWSVMRFSSFLFMESLLSFHQQHSICDFLFSRALFLKIRKISFLFRSRSFLYAFSAFVEIWSGGVHWVFVFERGGFAYFLLSC